VIRVSDTYSVAISYGDVLGWIDYDAASRSATVNLADEKGRAGRGPFLAPAPVGAQVLTRSQGVSGGRVLEGGSAVGQHQRVRRPSTMPRSVASVYSLVCNMRGCITATSVSKPAMRNLLSHKAPDRLSEC